MNKFIMLSLSLFTMNTAFADLRGLPTISVLTVPSSHQAVTEIIREYSRDNNITISATFDSASGLAEMIIDGEAADVFISDDYDYIERLKQQGMVHYNTERLIVKNKLVLAASIKHIVNQRFNGKLQKPRDVMQQIIGQILPITALVVADYSMLPLGKYTSQVLSKMGLWYKSKRFFLIAADSDNALYLVEKGNNIGILYNSDVQNNPELNVISEFETDDYDEIDYWATVVVDHNMQNGLGFIE